MKQKTVWVVVIGDYGRSPRMQYHSQQLLNKGFEVYAIGYHVSTPIESLQNNPNLKLIDAQIRQHDVEGTFAMILKVIMQILLLLKIALYQLPSPKFILVQIPPAIPAMVVFWIAAKFHRSSLVYDWHNFSYTLLEVNKKNKYLVYFARIYEKFFGKFSDQNFCVTQNMGNTLRKWNIESTTLYDRPHSQFKPIKLEEQHSVLWRNREKFENGFTQNDCLETYLKSQASSPRGSKTMKTHLVESQGDDGQETAEYRLNEDRFAIIVTATSWTPDEDIRLLIKALQRYDQIAINQTALYPKIVMVITGRGPQQEYYKKMIQDIKFEMVAFRFVFLSFADYSRILATSDLGVSLHYSSSGVDLPMKVLDMRGCKIPVLSIRYQSIGELIEEGVNGQLFESAHDLCLLFLYLLRNFPQKSQLQYLQHKCGKIQEISWDQEWEEYAWSVLKSL